MLGEFCHHPGGRAEFTASAGMHWPLATATPPLAAGGRSKLVQWQALGWGASLCLSHSQEWHSHRPRDQESLSTHPRNSVHVNRCQKQHQGVNAHSLRISCETETCPVHATDGEKIWRRRQSLNVDRHGAFWFKANIIYEMLQLIYSLKH